MDSLLKKLTIAVPVYNEKDFILEALKSCLMQAGTIQIYDNCSDDGSGEICKRFANQHSHVTYIRNTSNLGAFENFKLPLFKCKTEYFQWVGAHDILGKNYTLPLLEIAEKDPSISLVYGKTSAIDENGTVLRKKNRTKYTSKAQSDSPFERLKDYVENLRDGFIIHGVFRTEFLKQAWFDIPCIGNDDVLLFNAIAAGKTVGANLPVYLAREFPKLRKNIDDNERRTTVIVAEGAEPLENNLNPMMRSMTTKLIDLATNKSELAQAFEIMNALYFRHLEPKEKRRSRRFKKLLQWLLIILAIIILLASFL